MSEKMRYGRYISPHERLMLYKQVGKNMYVDGRLVVLPDIYVQFENGVYTTRDPEIIEWLDSHEMKNNPRGFYKEEGAEDDFLAREASHAIVEEQNDRRIKEALEEIGLQKVVAGERTSATLSQPQDVVWKNPTECPVCGFRAKSKFGLIAHLKKHKRKALEKK